MDKQQHPIDELFRKKLGKHQEKPSGLAWERLESQLGPAKSPKKGVWMRVAAMLIAVLGLTYLLWQYLPSEHPQAPAVAENTTPKPVEANKSPKSIAVPKTTEQAPLAEATPPVKEEPKAESKEKTKPAIQQKKPKNTANASEQPAQNVLPAAKATEEDLNHPTTKTTVPPLPQLEVPTPDMGELIAENNAAPAKEEKVSYKVSIKSSGISEKPKKEKLVEEIGDKINTLGGLLGKVDQGYADL